MPVNISGGLKSFGHPIGASGCAWKWYEIYKADPEEGDLPARQVKDVSWG